MSETDFLNLELDVLDWNQGELRVAGRKVLGHPQLSPELAQQLREQEMDPKEYGRLLFDALLPAGDPMLVSYRKALHDARRSAKLLRFKLTLSLTDAEELHRLCWERLYDREEDSAVARAPETAFSRYAPLNKDDATPTLDRPRLLLAIASPKDVEKHDMTEINREAMQRQLERALRPLEGQMDCEFLTPPVTPSRLRTRLFGGGFHALHLVAHGYVDDEAKTGVLVLEMPSARCDFIVEEDLSEIFLGDRSLRLLTLMTCHGGVPSIANPLSGLGRRLVARGLPAVISMQDTVSFDTAEGFAQHFYESLATSGCVDAAVNEARHQLFLTDMRSSRWSDPVLFMRLEDGAIWRHSREEEPPDEIPILPPARARDQFGQGMQVFNEGSSIGEQINVAGSATFNPASSTNPSTKRS